SVNRAPRQFTPGTDGEERSLELELKMIADVGLVGFPNAGKSTLLCQVSKAHPKVASYPFTTLNANVGVVELPDYRRMTIADIPGLIEGAHDNVGLGEAFLRHIERCRMLCYVLDMAGVDGRDPVDDLRILRKELEEYEPGMSTWPFVILANKMDMPEAEENLRRLRESEGPDVDIVTACAELAEGTAELIDLLQRRLDALPPVDEEAIRRVLSKHHRSLKTTAEIRGADEFGDWE
ncbi:MAG: 50S ribosome-binding GTPase, partial [Victivallales bacterium]|nr:50S ribosome-binding GTPase [Victivallales bacterium]